MTNPTPPLPRSEGAAPTANPPKIPDSSPAAAPAPGGETTPIDEPVMGMVYVAGNDSLAVIQTVGGDYLLVDHNDDSRPLARFVNEDSAQVVNRILSRMWAADALRRAPSDAGAPIGNGIECVRCAAIADAFTGAGLTEGAAPGKQRALGKEWPELYAALSSLMDWWRTEQQPRLDARAPTPTKGQRLSLLALPCRCGKQPVISIEKGGAADAWCPDVNCQKSPGLIVATESTVVAQWNAFVELLTGEPNQPAAAPSDAGAPTPTTVEDFQRKHPNWTRVCGMCNGSLPTLTDAMVAEVNMFAAHVALHRDEACEGCPHCIRERPPVSSPDALRAATDRAEKAEAFANRWMHAAMYAVGAADLTLAFDPTAPESFAESRRRAIDALMAKAEATESRHATVIERVKQLPVYANEPELLDRAAVLSILTGEPDQ